MSNTNSETLFQPLELPCGMMLKNRIIKSAMSDSLGDGRGNPTDGQIRLYQRWADGGVAAMIVGEVQGSPHFAEKPGNLVLRSDSEHARFKELAHKGGSNGAQLWLQKWSYIKRYYPIQKDTTLDKGLASVLKVAA